MRKNSLIDKILKRYDMKFELQPYRIVNKYGFIVQKERLDLRPTVLEAQKEVGKSRVLFQKSTPSTLDKNKN